LLNNQVSKVAINDLSPAIFSFWQAVLSQTDVLCDMVLNTPISIEEWHRQKAILAKGEIGIALGYAALFLNRVNRSGILTAGVIGGKDQSGAYKLDCRFNKLEIIRKIKAIAYKKEQVLLCNLDANDFLTTVVSEMNGSVLVNIDPPYYNKGKSLYQNFFVHEDHVKLFHTIKALRHPWMVTYDNTPEIAEIYAEFSPEPFFLNYSAQVKRRGAELVMYSPDLDTSGFKLGMELD
jgi:DNA adenine methylase